MQANPLLSKIVFLGLAFLICVTSGCSLSAQVSGPRLVAYLKLEDVPGLNPDALAHIDDLIYTRVGLLPNGDLQLPESWSEDMALLKRYHESHPQLQILISIAGKQSNAEGFPVMSAEPEARTNFARSLVQICQQYGLQGVDIDWEYPRTEQEQKQAALLFADLKKALSKQGLKLTAAFNYAESQVNFLATVADHIDQIHLMTYEPAPEGQNLKTFQDLINHGVSNVTNADINKIKVMIGVPFFGRLEGTREWLSYHDIVERFQPAPEQNLARGYQFVGPELMRRNAQFARDNGWGGIMLWSLGYDHALEHPKALLPVIDANL